MNGYERHYYELEGCKNVNFGQTPETGVRKFVLDVLNFFGNLFA